MKKQPLSYYEKRSIVSMVAMLVVYGSMFYDARTYYNYVPAKQGLLNFWGNQFLELFLCLVVVHIVVMFAFNALNKKLTGESCPKVKDERDNAIELKAVNAGHYTLALGVFIAMLAALRVENYSPIFLIIMGSFMASGVVSDSIRIAQYRKNS